MKFYLDSKRCFYRDEFNKNLLLMSLVTNQTFDLSAEFRPLINYADRWVNFEYFYRIVSLFSFGRCKRKELAEFLFQLNASGIVDIEDFPASNFTGIRQVQLADYHRLAEFCRANFAKGFSRAVYGDENFYQDSIFFNRLEKAIDTTIIAENEGNIEAALICGRADHFYGGEVLALKSFIFAEGLSETACRDKIHQMADFVVALLKGILFKVRYEKTSDRQDFIVENLLDNGFAKTAFFPKEYDNRVDLTLYDRFL